MHSAVAPYHILVFLSTGQVEGPMDSKNSLSIIDADPIENTGLHLVRTPWTALEHVKSVDMAFLPRVKSCGGQKGGERTSVCLYSQSPYGLASSIIKSLSFLYSDCFPQKPSFTARKLIELLTHSCSLTAPLVLVFLHSLPRSLATPYLAPCAFSRCLLQAWVAFALI